jgi:hypothetical protein
MVILTCSGKEIFKLITNISRSQTEICVTVITCVNYLMFMEPKIYDYGILIQLLTFGLLVPISGAQLTISFT